MPPGVSHRYRSFDEALELLQKTHAAGYQAFAEDLTTMHATQRRLQVAVDALVDIANWIIAARQGRKPVNAADSFKVLGELGVIGADHVEPLKEWVRQRNVVVHEYATLVPEKIFASLARIDALAACALQLKAHLDTSEV